MKLTRAINALSALAQEHRLAVFRLLVKRGPQGLPAGHIASRLDIPPATLSFHLNQLSHAGLVKSTREGRSIIYAANYAQMNRLMDFLSDNCCAEQGGADACCPPSDKPRTRGEPKRSAFTFTFPSTASATP